MNSLIKVADSLLNLVCIVICLGGCLCLVSCGDAASSRVVRYDKVSGYTIITDTIQLEASAYLPPVCNMVLNQVERYRDRILCRYCFYNYTSFIEELDLANGEVILSFDKDGKDAVQIPTPVGYPEFNRGYRSIRICHDTLYFFNRYAPDGCYWDESTQAWIKVDCVPSTQPNYMDEQYIVTGKDCGEWGDYIQFHERSTGMNYLWEGAMLETFKLDGAYYIVSPFDIRKITDPHKGWEMEDSIRYFSWGSYAPPIGAVFRTKYRNQWEYEYRDENSEDTLFCSAFLRKGLLHTLVRGKDDAYIARYKKARHGDIEKVVSIGDIPIIYEKNRNQNNTLLLHFNQDWQTDGILDIMGDTIRVTYQRKQYDSLRYVGRLSLEEALCTLPGYLHTSTMDSVRAFENKIGGQSNFFIRETDSRGFTNSRYANRVLGTSFPIEKEEETGYESILYYHAIDGHTSFRIRYTYSQESGILTAFWIELRETEYLNGDKGVQDITSQQFCEMITKALSVSPDSAGLWHKDGITYELYARGDNKCTLYVQKLLP